MYTIRVNSDNSISTIINQNIAQGYKLSDWFWIFSDQYYKDKDMTNCEAMIEFILPKSQEVISEKLLLKPDLLKQQIESTVALSYFNTSDGDYITTNTGEKIILNEN